MCTQFIHNANNSQLLTLSHTNLLSVKVCLPGKTLGSWSCATPISVPLENIVDFTLDRWTPSCLVNKDGWIRKQSSQESQVRYNACLQVQHSNPFSHNEWPQMAVLSCSSSLAKIYKGAVIHKRPDLEWLGWLKPWKQQIRTLKPC